MEATKNNTPTPEDNNVVYTLDVEVQQIKGVTDDGRKYDFLAFETYDKRGQRVKLKFRKELKDQLPTYPGNYVLKVDKRYIARDKKSKYPVYWVRQIISFEPLVFDDVDNTEDLPF